MKATKIYFERTKSFPGFNNQKIGIEIHLEKGDKADDVMKKASAFISKQFGECPTQEQVDNALLIIEKSQDGDLPF